MLSLATIAGLAAVVGTIAIRRNTSVSANVDQVMMQNTYSFYQPQAARQITYHTDRIRSSLKELLSNIIDHTPIRERQAKQTIAESTDKLQRINALWAGAIKFENEMALNKRESQEKLQLFENLSPKIETLVAMVNKTVTVRTKEGSHAAAALFTDKVEPLLTEIPLIANNIQPNPGLQMVPQANSVKKAINYSVLVSIILIGIAFVAVVALGCCLIEAVSLFVSRPRRIVTNPAKDRLSALPHTRTATSASDANTHLQPPVEPDSSLKRRVKQLKCFYGLSSLAERPNIFLEEIFTEACELIRKAYQYPDAICVRITFDGVQYKTDNFSKSETSQCASIRTRGNTSGSVETYYLGEKTPTDDSPFLAEEREMLDAVANQLSRIAGVRQYREKLQLFRSLIDRSNDCIFALDPKWGRILDTNERACETLGYKRTELLDMTIKDIGELVDEDSSWEQHLQKLTSTEDVIIQSIHRRSDGTSFFVETSLKLVSHRKEDYVIAITRDITERKRAEENQAQLIRELKTTNQKVESINQELKEFAYVISHDLKAPLRGIKTLADWLLTDYGDKLDDDGKQQLNLLQTRVGRMHNLIEGVLRYSRIGRIREKRMQVDLSELVPEITDMVAPPDNITVNIEGQMPVILCEKTSIIQVFENLLSNAIKYMDKQQGEITVGCVEQNDCWLFSVADNGPGIDEKYFGKIFKIFQTLQPRDKFESTGVGLTVIKKIVELFGGKVWVESKLGQGSTFFFTLPKSEFEVKNAEFEANIAC